MGDRTQQKQALDALNDFVSKAHHTRYYSDENFALDMVRFVIRHAQWIGVHPQRIWDALIDEQDSSETSEKRRYLKLPPEMGDGQHWTVHKLDRMDEHSARELSGIIHAWAHDTEAKPGDSFTIGVVAMTPEEVEALPDV